MDKLSPKASEWNLMIERIVLHQLPQDVYKQRDDDVNILHEGIQSVSRAESYSVLSNTKTLWSAH